MKKIIACLSMLFINVITGINTQNACEMTQTGTYPAEAAE